MIKNIEYTLTNSLVILFAFVPRSWAKNIGYFLGSLWFVLDKKRNFMAVHNLTKIYGNKMNRGEIKKLARKNFIFHVITFFDICRLKRLSNEGILKEVESIEGTWNYLNAKQKGKPIFILSAHFGNWELMATLAPLILGHPIHLIARKLDANGIDRVIKEIRTKTGNRVIDKKHDPKIVRDIIRNNNTIGMLLDQRALKVDSVEVPFIGFDARTNKGLALFDLRYNPEIIPIFSYRQKNGKYRIKILPAVKKPKRHNLKEDVKIYTTLYNEVMGKEIFENPDHWFWFHDRWEKKDTFFKKKKKKS